jgi:hypothetical protein
MLHTLKQRNHPFNIFTIGNEKKYFSTRHACGNLACELYQTCENNCDCSGSNPHCFLGRYIILKPQKKETIRKSDLINKKRGMKINEKIFLENELKEKMYGEQIRFELENMF